MSWIRENTLNFFQMLFVKILKSGHVPNHVAFIMDGNRRYANKCNVNSLGGHTKGFDKLAETLQWCLDFGIKEVTVYAFSIENFRRSKDEVDGLIKLAEEKFQRLLDERDKLMEHGVKVCIIGNISMIPANLRKLMAEAMRITKNNNKALLNVAFAYTSRDEITQTVKTIVQGVNDNNIQPEDVDSELFSKCLYTSESSNPDLIIRTSGEVRFSDFLLWQISHACVYFTNTLWPEFNIWDLIAAVFHYQRSYIDLQDAQLYEHPRSLSCHNRAIAYINMLDCERQRMLELAEKSC
ncbi:hypothetical protein PV325_006325 [Microctonus aethiopoides]|uniref:Alkyl transferase n=1 Tax=Microctonus aethiopoides TaxID=144406 RepID=A0AA39KTX9_9HYME|nr:hypothetical protein PV325_006325 [Microctonus aethiopoides]KAK0173813.1 hypothetical protein PV328_006956 [Microctonus aethiopoides]